MRALWLSCGLMVMAGSGCRGSMGSPGPDSPECLLETQGAGPDGAVPFEVDVVASGLEVPWGLAFLPGGDVLVTERPGRVRVMQNGQLVPQPVATLDLDASAEGGLLGIALHPDFASNRLFFLYLTDAGTNRVERWTLSEDHRSATLDRVIIAGIPGAPFHDGGRLRIGPDRMLYIGTGDAGEPTRAQSLDSPAGKILRLTPEGEVPSDNPTPGSAAFILGIRNTQGFDWRDNQTLYVTDHGPSGDLGLRGLDEVSVARAGDNLGWPEIHACQTRPGMVSPSLVWQRAVPPGGAAIYRGDAISEWTGSLLIAVLGDEHLHRVQFDAQNPSRVASHEVYLKDRYGRLREVVMGPDNHLWVTTSNCDGRGTCGEQRDLILRLRR